MKHLETLLTKTLEFVLAMLLLAISGTVVALVVLRYVFNSSITGANELVTILFVYTTAVGAALAIGKREHIAIPFAVEALPRRAQKFADIVGLVLVATLNAVMLGYSIGWIRITGEYLMPSTGLPRAVAQLSVPLGCGLAVVYCMLRLLVPVAAQQDAAEHEVPPSRRGGSAE